MDEILESLNEEQKKAVLHIDTPLLVLAGAGSGKTRVITHKIMYLIREKKIPLDRILAITFTNKAGSEMRERVKKSLNLTSEPRWILTFHSLALKILRFEVDSIDLSRDFVVYDEEDSINILKDIFAELNIQADKQDLKRVKEIISDIKQSNDEFVLEIYKQKEKFIEEIFNLYQKKLVESNAVDFDDILIKAVKLFEEREDILQKWKSRFDYILVDEYQDTNKIQHKLLKQLVGNRNCITVVGDPQQCIYTWRGAHPENILDFEKDFPNTKIIKLERNYRSTKKILDLANKIIQKSSGKWKKKVLVLWTDKIGNEDITLYKLPSEKYESRFIVEMVKRYNSKGYKFSDMAILIRMGYLSRILEEDFIKANIPYQIIGGLKFYERAEIKDLIGYIRFSINPNDTQAFKRVINLPPRQLGDKTIKELERIKAEKGLNWIDTLKLVLENDDLLKLNKKQKEGIHNFLNIIDSIKELGNVRPYEALTYLIDEIDYYQFLKQKYPKDYQDRVNNVEELKKVFLELDKQKKSLTEFLEETTLSQGQDSLENNNSVKIMTVHASKGLEFPIVFLPALEEGIFPSGKSLINPIELEEERRLFYVAITRAKEHLILSLAEKRTSFNGKLLNSKASRFLKDIREDIKVKKLSLNKKNKTSEKKVIVSSSATGSIKKGDLVRHKKYGKGFVVEVNHPFAIVIFEKEGEKKIKIDFLEKI
ncbi:MAG: DNA helicase UvrD [Persephonella sp.]|nr:MAG: DNA helicase UvrD [Persephonella sp.]